MGDLFIRCQFGQKRKDGKIVRPATCENRASGLFMVHFMRGKPRPYLLCAQCAFDKMPNRVRCLPAPDGAPKDTPPTYFRDVFSVKLLTSLTTTFDQTNQPRAEGLKHWVERKAELPEKISIPKVRVHESRGKKMDMSAYLNSLKRHDDGK